MLITLFDGLCHSRFQHKRYQTENKTIRNHYTKNLLIEIPIEENHLGNWYPNCSSIHFFVIWDFLPPNSSQTEQSRREYSQQWVKNVFNVQLKRVEPLKTLNSSVGWMLNNATALLIGTREFNSSTLFNWTLKTIFTHSLDYSRRDCSICRDLRGRKSQIKKKVNRGENKEINCKNVFPKSVSQSIASSAEWVSIFLFSGWYILCWKLLWQNLLKSVISKVFPRLKLQFPQKYRLGCF